MKRKSLYWMVCLALLAFACSNFQLMADIELTGTWTPIGSLGQPFTGTFDGNGHVIKGLYVNTDSSEVGMFGYVQNGTIKNIGLEDVTIFSHWNESHI